MNGLRTAINDHVTEVDSDDVSALLRDCDDTCDTTTVDSIRLAMVDLVRLISRHRQAGADLVCEGYTVDIGGG